MSRLSRVFLTISIALMLAGTATCYFGERHAVNQIPPEVRAKMSDTDWVGVEWIVPGMCMVLLGLGVGVLPVLVKRTSWLRSR